MKYSHNTICTTLYITLYKQHVHTLYIHNTTCTQHYRCNIYSICTTVALHIQNHIVLPENLASSISLPSMLILACLRSHYFHSADVSLRVTYNNTNIGIIQAYNINSYPHDTDLVDFPWLLFPLDSSWTRNLFMSFTYISNHSSTRMISGNPIKQRHAYIHVYI